MTARIREVSDDGYLSREFLDRIAALEKQSHDNADTLTKLFIICRTLWSAVFGGAGGSVQGKGPAPSLILPGLPQQQKEPLLLAQDRNLPGAGREGSTAP